MSTVLVDEFIIHKFSPHLSREQCWQQLGSKMADFKLPSPPHLP